MTELVTNNPLLNALSLTLLHFLWQGLLVALVLKLFFQFIPYQKPHIRYVAAAIAMLANLALPVTTFFVIYNPSYLQEFSQLQSFSFSSSMLTTSLAGQDFWYSQFKIYLPYLAVAWMATVCLLACKLLVEVYSVNRLTKSAVITTPAQLEGRFNELVSQLKLTQQPKLLISLKVDVPMAIGWLKPVVLLPASMLTGLTPAQLDMLILHELAHIKRYDYLVNFLQTLVEVLLFFHPAVVWVSNQMRNEREYCSDDIAVHACGNAIAYAHTLTDTAAHCQKHRHHAIPGMAMAASGGDLKLRVLRLVDQHHCASINPFSKWLASAVTISMLIAALHYLVKLPIIDPITGNFSLLNNKATKDLPFSPLENTDSVLTQTTLAQQLLTKDTHQDAIAIDPQIVDVSKDKKDLLEIAQTQVSETSEHLVKPSIKKTVSLKPRKALIATQQAEQPSPASMAERAFARTESKVQNTQLTRPYESAFNRVNDSFDTSPSSRAHIYGMTSLLGESIGRSQLLEEHREDATLISSVPPKYPATAMRRGIELDVTVHFTINSDGDVTDIEFDSTGRVSYFRSAIKAALTQWEFLPAAVDGKPVESQMTKIFSFSLAN